MEKLKVTPSGHPGHTDRRASAWRTRAAWRCCASLDACPESLHQDNMCEHVYAYCLAFLGCARRRAETRWRADGVPGMRFETHDSASMLFRHVDIDLAAYPMLAWRWYIELPIRSPLDERTREGDDHPARLFLRFLTDRGDKRAMEVIWGNRLKPGDYKYIGNFPHFVADAGEDRVGRWLDERIDLARVYAEIWKDTAPAHLVDIAAFCDSDDTHTASVSYFAYVRLERRWGYGSALRPPNEPAALVDVPPLGWRESDDR